MTNPDGFPQLIRITLYRKGTAGTIVLTEGTSAIIKPGWAIEWHENYAKEVRIELDNTDATSTVNLLSASCAQWSGGVTGAVAEGDGVKVELYDAGTSAFIIRFRGVIRKIENLDGGAIRLTAKDYFERCESARREVVVYANMASGAVFDVTVVAGRRAMTGVSAANIAYPFIEVAFAHTDITVSPSDGSTSGTHDLNLPGEYVEQAFIAPHDAMCGVRFEYLTATYHATFGTVSVEIFEDNGANAPSTEKYIVDKSATVVGDTAAAYLAASVDLCTSNAPATLRPGQKYWLRITADDIPVGAGYIRIKSGAADTDDIIDNYFYNNGAGRQEEAGNCVNCDLDFMEYVDIPWGSYTFDAASNLVYINNDDAITTVGGAYYTVYRGRLTYYYGNLTTEAIFQRLIRSDTGMLHDVGTDCDRVLTTFSTRGKTIADCIRALCDIYENTGAWSGRQHVVAHYEDGSNIQRCKIGYRKNITLDSADYILSHPLARPTHPDEHIIIGEPGLKKTTNHRYASVTVVGKDPGGNPLVATRHDRAKTASFYEALSGMTEQKVIYDDNLRTLQECNDEAYRFLRAVDRDYWEGTIELTGQHLLMDWTTTSESYGSGAIVSLYWPRLGMSAYLVRVTGIVVTRYKTTIWVNGVDPLRQNRFLEAFKNTEKLDMFLAPIGYGGTIYAAVYDSTAITSASTLYMALCDSGGNQLSTCVRVPCTRFTDTTFNLRTYHAEFEEYNSMSNDPIEYIKLFDAQDGGSLIGSLDLNRTVSSIEIDERPNKFKNRLVIDYNCKNS